MMPPTTLDSMTPAQRAHSRRVIWLLVAYAIILPPLIWLHAHRPIGNSVSTLMAIVCSLPVLGMFASWGRYLSDERDEYHQAMVLRRIAVATNVTMGTAVVWGFLQTFGAMPLIEVYWIPVVWVVAQGIPALFSRRSA